MTRFVFTQLHQLRVAFVSKQPQRTFSHTSPLPNIIEIGTKREGRDRGLPQIASKSICGRSNDENKTINDFDSLKGLTFHKHFMGVE